MDYLKAISLLALLLLTTISGMPFSDAGDIVNDISTIDDVIVVPSDSDLIKRRLKKVNSNKDESAIAQTSNDFSVNSLKSKNIRITLGTSILNGIHIKVVDDKGMPVKGLRVSTEAVEGISVAPGWLHDQLLEKMETNESGEFVGMLVAEYEAAEKKVIDVDDQDKSISSLVTFGAGGVAPSVDEFDKRIPGSQPYQIALNVAGETLIYNIEIDMGPVLVSTHRGADMFNAAQWIGKMTENPVEMELRYYQRTDECVYVNNNVDDDLGVWTDEDYSLDRIRRIVISDLPHTAEAERYDKRNNSIKLIKGGARDDLLNRINGNKYNGYIIKSNIQDGNYINNKASAQMVYFVVMDHAKGASKVIFSMRDVKLIFDSDLCKHKDIVHQLSSNNPFLRIVNDGFTNMMPLRNVSPSIQVVVKDDMPPEPDPDPLPHIKSYSGLKLENLVIKINDEVIFGETIKHIEMGRYPNYCEVLLDNVNVELLDEKTLKESAPGKFEFVYYPTLDQLNVDKANHVVLSGMEDRVGNKTADSSSNFTMP